MLDVARLSIFGAKEFATRRQIEKKRAHLDLRARRLAAVARGFELATGDEHFRPGDRVLFPSR